MDVSSKSKPHRGTSSEFYHQVEMNRRQTPCLTVSTRNCVEGSAQAPCSGHLPSASVRIQHEKRLQTLELQMLAL